MQRALLLTGPSLDFGGRANGPASFFRRWILAALLGTTWSMATATAVLADGPERGRLLVPGDHFQPGDTMAVSGTDLDEGLQLTLRLTNGSTTAELGSVVVGADQTFSTTLQVPTSFPLGYAELTAVDALEHEWSVLVLVGDRAEGPDAGSGGQSLPDERTIALGVLAIGLIVFGLALLSFVRSRRRSSQR